MAKYLYLIFLLCLFSFVESCTYGSLRLVGGSTSREGRLEICINNVWGTVCDGYLNTKALAKVACRQLGYSILYATYHSSPYFGVGSGTIWLDDVQCTGTEGSLLQCSHGTIGNNYCSHSEDVTISCPESECTYGSLRLVGGTYSYEGRLEICINNVWGTVCDDGWSTTNAQVVCKQLGYPTAGAIYHSNAYYGAGSGSILLDDVHCYGSESELKYCSHNTIGSSDCGHSEDVGVSCPGVISSSCNSGSLRLVGGSTSHEGRLEICINNVWGTVCDDLFTNTNARVVCRQLGYSTTGATYHGNAYYGQGSGSILLDNVQCNGYESSLLSCTHNSIGSNDCSHGEDVGVSCGSASVSSSSTFVTPSVSSSSTFVTPSVTPSPTVNPVCTYGSARLVGGSNSHEGRVEVCINGVWDSVCSHFFGNRDAKVVCRQLGYSENGARAVHSAYFGPGNGPILLDNIQCTGSELRLIDCIHTRNSNSACTLVWVTCKTSLQPSIIAAIVASLGCTCLCYICCTITIIVCYRKRKNAHLYSVFRSPSVTNVTTDCNLPVDSHETHPSAPLEEQILETYPPNDYDNQPLPSYSEAMQQDDNYRHQQQLYHPTS